MENTGKNTGFFSSISGANMNELRKMIIGLDTEDLKRLTTLINDPEAFSEEISELLPHSIKIMLDKGNVSYAELTSVIEDILKDSVKSDPQTMADILFPIMLPAIRKAVAEDIRNMVNSLNTTLEHGFSLRRIGWRFKAIFSGMSYAEIVLSHAYVFRVKQVFLIHKKTGLLLHSKNNEDEAVTKDADMVSSMLTAIKDFIQDSFNVDQNNELDTIKVGKFNIWIEQGPEAIVAAIVDGDAYSGLRTILKETIEKIHLRYSYQLEKFDGETSIFEKTEPYLESCLISESKKKKENKPIILIFLLLIIIGASGYWAYLSIDHSIKVSQLESQLINTPGIVIVNYANDNGKTFFYGLRDPYAKNPIKLLTNFNLDTSQIGFNLKPYISLDKDILLNRSYNILNPPKTIALTIDNNSCLWASGSATEKWYEFAKINYNKIPGIVDFDTINVHIIRSFPTPEAIQEIFLSIEDYYFVFTYNKFELSEKQKAKFANLIDEVNTVLDFNFDQDSVPVIEVIGHTSYAGNAEANKVIAFERSQQFINHMIEAGIPLEVLVPKTDFIEDINYRFPVRSVSFKVVYLKPEDL